MKFYNFFFQKFRLFCVLIVCVLLIGTAGAQEEKAIASALTSITLKLTDENGVPVPNAQVVIGEGIIQGLTDESGVYSFMGYPRDFISIFAPGYENSIVLVQDVINENSIKLKKSKLFMNSNDGVSLPFQTQNKRHFTGSSNVIFGNQLERYPSTDLRNAFTGLIPGLQVTEYDGSPGLTPEEKLGNFGITEKIGVKARGGKMIYIIDDIPVDITEMTLDPQEIESVTVIKDIIGKAMYGPLGADGIILIKTKRGRINRQIMTVNAESGVSVIDRFPGSTSGADYAILNNLARQNDGMEPLYSDSEISAYSNNNPNDLYNPSANFRDIMLKDTRSFRRVNVSSSGGSEAVQYSVYLGYNGEGDIYKIGPNAAYNRLTASSNVDIKITEDISVQFGINTGLTLRTSPNFGYAIDESSEFTDILELNSALPYINTTPPNAFPVYANNDPTLKYPWFGVSPVYTVNPVGNLISNGAYTETGRNSLGKLGIDYNLSKLIKGLTSQSFLGFNTLNLVRTGIAENYLAYIATPSKTAADEDTILFSKVHDGEVSSEQRNLHDYYFKRFEFFQKLDYQRSFGNHEIQSTLTYLLYKVIINGIKEPHRQQNGVWTLKYSNNDKYILQGVLNYAGTFSFEKGERTRVFPAAGVSWIISEESFLSNLKFINFLKLRADAGILGYENFITPFLYRDRFVANDDGTAFGPHSANRWFGTKSQSVVYRVSPSRIGHPGLSWETRKEYSIGVDGLMFNQKLSFEVNYYNNLHEGIISRMMNLPFISGVTNAAPSINYNSIRYYGLETGIQITKNLGRLKYSFGGNTTIQYSEYVKFDEPDYRFDYQFNEGKPVDAYWGQTYLEKFQSDEEALAIPQVFDAILKAGDLKYKDMNDDGFIDDNDMNVIGNTEPRLFYSLNANLGFKNLELSIIGTGEAFKDLPLTNSYYWNGWGDNNYSNFVKNNLGESYPRLTYYKVNNNFVNSNFWLTSGGYFKIQNIELAFNIGPDNLKVIRSHGMRLFIRGANLLTITKVKDVDPESINSGVTTYPLYKTFTGGIKFTF